MNVELTDDELDLIKAAGVPIFAPSANPTGTADPRSAEEVGKSLGRHVDMILDAGPSLFGEASTVVKVEDDGIEILRRGAVPEEEIRKALEGVEGES